MKKTTLKKVSKAPVSRLQKKCDALLTPIIISKSPRCLLCSNPTQVAHHHVHKSKSNRLRYELANLINLCHKCHQALHHNESYYASKIVLIKGLEWFAWIETAKRESIKTDRQYYEAQYERLKKLSPPESSN